MAIGQAMPKGSLKTSLRFSSSGSTRILGRKRVAVSLAPSPSRQHSPVRTLRKQHSIRFHMDDAINLVGSLPQDVLINILCMVNHSDLRQLLQVSKSVSKATLVARELHFAFITPCKPAARAIGDEEEKVDPGTPMPHRVARSLPAKNLASITVNLSTAFDSLL